MYTSNQMESRAQLNMRGVAAAGAVSALSLMIASCTVPVQQGAGMTESVLPVTSANVQHVPPPFDHTVRNQLMPELKSIIDQLLAQKRDMTMDGVRVFESNDKFLPGKIAIGMAHLIIDGNPDAAEKARLLKGFREISALTVNDTNDTWGVYYYMSALNSLRKAGLLDQAVTPKTLAKLRAQLDWRTFVRENELTLIDLPNNYFGVAFSIARLRYLMGWEDESGSDKLLAKSLKHYREYSGEFGFADETPGAGRFDRYSVLLIGEFAQRFIETGIEPPPEIRRWLRGSVDLMMLRLNPRGEGFEYGRSLGPYSETAFLEVLSAAASLGILTSREQEVAYAFSSRVAERYQDVWFDEDTGSVNMWDKGRRTDAYRGKHRILGENLSLSHQMIYTNNEWNDLGYKGKAPTADIMAYTATLPKSSITYFSKGTYDRGVVTVLDGNRVIGLPVINGSLDQHNHNPYFPIPFSPGMLEGSADADYPQLVPQFTMADGSVLMPLAWFTGLTHTVENGVTTVDFRQNDMDLMGEKEPRKDDRMSVETRYVFSSGKITRTDRYTLNGDAAIKSVEMQFASLSHDPQQAGLVTRYGHGGIKRFAVEGLQKCTVKDSGLDPVYRISAETLNNVVICRSDNPRMGRNFTISWTMDYDPVRK